MENQNKDVTLQAKVARKSVVIARKVARKSVIIAQKVARFYVFNTCIHLITTTKHVSKEHNQIFCKGDWVVSKGQSTRTSWQTS